MTTVPNVTLTAALLGPALAGANAARPLITFYDDATGERIELSGVTTANWAAKAANLLRDECDVEPGTRIAVLLPAHWQTAAVLLAGWWCGAEVVSPLEANWVSARRRFALAWPPTLRRWWRCSWTRVGKVCPPALRSDRLWTEVRCTGEFLPWTPLPLRLTCRPDPCGEGWPRRERAAELHLGPTDRVLSTLDWGSVDGLSDGLLAVLAGGASLVQCRNPDPAALTRRADTERTTVRLA